MKKLLSLLTTVVVATLPLIAHAGGEYHDSGCGAEVSDGCAKGVLWGVAVGLGLFVLWGVYDVYKMRTDPAYRARAEEIRRELDERHHG